MTTATVTATPRARFWHIAAPALVSIATLVFLTLLIDRTWGRPEDFPSVDAYRFVMDLAVLAKVGPAFLSALIVWPAMRLRGATLAWAAVGALSSAIVFGVLGALQALTFFPAAQAAYYGLNPMVIGACGSQVACSALGEVYVRWRRGGITALRDGRLWLVALGIAAAGFAVFFVAIVWDGGRHWFYVWIQGFMMVFGDGQ